MYEDVLERERDERGRERERGREGGREGRREGGREGVKIKEIRGTSVTATDFGSSERLSAEHH